jgi:hypothetical protein
MKRISKSKQRRIDEKRYNDNLFNNITNLSKEEQVYAKANLLINPIQVTYAIGSDTYIKTIVDFKRNGKTIILCNGKEFVYKQKKTQDYPRYQAKTGSFGFIYFSFLENKRDRSF